MLNNLYFKVELKHISLLPSDYILPHTFILKMYSFCVRWTVAQLYYWWPVNISKTLEWFGVMERHRAAHTAVSINPTPQTDSGTQLLELHRSWSWSCVAVFGWIWTAKKNLQYWHRTLSSWSYTIYIKCFIFQFNQSWQVYLARHRLRKWINSRVGVNADVV